MGNHLYMCPLCKKDNPAYLGDVRGNKVLCCSSCGLAFMDLEDDYSYDHQDWYAWLTLSEDKAREYLNYGKRIFARQLRILAGMTKGRDLLDIGAGVGIFAKVAAQGGWRPICVDINTRAKEFGSRFYGLTYKDLRELQPGTMDVVRLFHVLEHIDKPVEFLQEVSRLVKPGGICVTAVPHYEPLSCLIRNKLLRLAPGKHDFRGQIYLPGHVLGFTVSSLTSTFALHGFRAEKFHCISRGNLTYYPWEMNNLKGIVKNVIYEAVNTIGNVFQRGSWIVGYFRKT